MIKLETENNYFKQGYKLIAGVDEAGRGPLAGPVVAACVIIDENINTKDLGMEMINDSKKLSAKKRELLFSLIKKNALSVEISVINNEVIDNINILQASLLAMKKSILKSKLKPDIVLIDGNQKIKKLEIKQESFINGDAKVWVIAAASIIAKVSRDFLMEELAKQYPQYEFQKHKGYGTKIHYEKLKENGACPIHRKSFNLKI